MEQCSFDIVPYSIAYKADLGFVKQLYEQSFPFEERRPWHKQLELLANEPRFCLFLIQVNKKTQGFLSCWRIDDFVYGEHFAINPAERGKGIGRKVIDYLWKTSASVPWVFEVEHPTTAIAERRLNFYLSHGATILSKDYYQPAYCEGKEGLPLLFLGVGANEQQTQMYINRVYEVAYKVKSKTNEQ